MASVDDVSKMAAMVTETLISPLVLSGGVGRGQERGRGRCSRRGKGRGTGCKMRANDRIHDFQEKDMAGTIIEVRTRTPKRLADGMLFVENRERKRKSKVLEDLGEKVNISPKDSAPFCSKESTPVISPKPLDIQTGSPHTLPLGVIQGCEKCHYKGCLACRKVVARWRESEGRRPIGLKEAPTFYPTIEEFKDPIKFIMSKREIAEKYGICRIRPPTSWRPPFTMNSKEWRDLRKTFPTLVQQTHKLQIREAFMKNETPKEIIKALEDENREQNISDARENVMLSGGVSKEVKKNCEKIRRGKEGEKKQLFQFQGGHPFTYEEYEEYANGFEASYFQNKTKEGGEVFGLVEDGPEGALEKRVEQIEGEFWRIVDTPTEQIEVLYGSDVDTSQFGSGFPTSKKGEPKPSPLSYKGSPWNLQNIARFPGSILSFEENEISGVVVPWLYLGMCLSSFCWHVEDHHLYSINYLHQGAPKLWYSVGPENYARLEEVMRRRLPHLFHANPSLMHSLVTQLSPAILQAEGVPVSRIIQTSGDFIVTFPKSYHSGFNCGFNIAEAVNLAPPDWLPEGQLAVELYSQQERKTSISHDKLLLLTALKVVELIFWSGRKEGGERSIVVGGGGLEGEEEGGEEEMEDAKDMWMGLAGPNSVVAYALKARSKLEFERRRRKLIPARFVRMLPSFDEKEEKECCFCFYDLHFSAVFCHCQPQIFSCIEHATELCKCKQLKILLYRYDFQELKTLIEAVEGKEGALERWREMEKVRMEEILEGERKEKMGNSGKLVFRRVFAKDTNEDKEIDLQLEFRE